MVYPKLLVNSRFVFAVFTHLFLLIVVYSVFLFLGFIDQFPQAENFNRWDAGWYKSIMENGYSFVKNQQSNVAFFPLFPYLWKISNLGLRGISLLNAIIFFLSIILLIREFKIGIKEILLFLSFPSLVFMYVPYTEATFFLFGTLALIGLQRNSTPLIWIGLFLCCLTRSATLLFFPAIIFMEIMDWKAGKSAFVKFKNIIIYLSAAIISMLTVAYIQWYQTKEWFPFLGVHKYWGHTLRFPEFPLTTWGGYRLLWLDGIALWVGLGAGVFCAFLLYRTLVKKPIQLSFSRPVLFSAGYLIGASVFVLLFQGGSIILHRYIFATPFFLMLLFNFLQLDLFTNKKMILVVLFVTIITVLFWLLLGANKELDSMNYFQTIWYFSLMTIYLLSFAFIKHPVIGRHIISVIYFLNLIFQIYLFNIFLRNEWAG